MTRQRLAFLRQPFLWWVLFLLTLTGAGAVGGVIVFSRGLVVTNLSDLVPWGLWITIDLSSIALSAGAFMLSAAVYLLGLKQFQPVARTAVFVGLIGYSMACLMLLLDIGRPDRFWHGFVFWNIHSPLWEVTMCVGLYFTVLVLEVLPIFGRTSLLQSRLPRLARLLTNIHHLAPVLAVLGLGLSMLHQSSLGATYGILKARPFWFHPGLPVLFMISAMAGGMSLTILLSSLAARFSTRAVIDRELLAQLSRFVGWVLVAYLYMRLWDVLAVSYTYDPARSEALRLLTRGPMALNFWAGEIALGAAIPIVLLLLPPFRNYERFRILAVFLVVAGVVAYRWDTNLVGQLVVVGQLPHVQTPLYTYYVPSLIEIVTGLGVIAYGVLAFSLGVRYLRVVVHAPEEVVAATPPVVDAPAVLSTSS